MPIPSQQIVKIATWIRRRKHSGVLCFRDVCKKLNAAATGKNHLQVSVFITAGDNARNISTKNHRYHLLSAYQYSRKEECGGETTDEEFMERKESTVRSLLLQLAGKGFTVDQVNEVLRAAASLAGMTPFTEGVIYELDKGNPWY